MALNPQNLGPGEEQHEIFNLSATLVGRRRAGQKRVQYDYRHTDGTLFSCVAPSLDKARAKRDEWFEKKETHHD